MALISGPISPEWLDTVRCAILIVLAEKPANLGELIHQANYRAHQISMGEQCFIRAPRTPK